MPKNMAGWIAFPRLGRSGAGSTRYLITVAGAVPEWVMWRHIDRTGFPFHPIGRKAARAPQAGANLLDHCDTWQGKPQVCCRCARNGWPETRLSGKKV